MNKDPFETENIESNIQKENSSLDKNFMSINEKTLFVCFDNLEDGIIWFNNELIIMHANASAEKITGFTKDELRGKKVSTIFQNINEEQIFQLIGKSKTERSVLKLELNLLSKEMDKILVEAKFIFNQKDNCNIVIINDISSQKKQIQELKFSKKILREVIDQIPQMIFVKDREGKFLLANQSLAASFDLSIEEIENSFQHDIQPVKSETDYFLQYDKKVIETQTKLRMISSFTDAFGKKRTIEVRKKPIKLPNGDFAALGVATDITKHVERENKLKETSSELTFLVEQKNKELIEEKLKLEAIFETTSSGLLFIDEEGNFSLYNKKFEEYFSILYPTEKHPLSSQNIFSPKFENDLIFSFIKKIMLNKEKACNTFEFSEDLFIQVSAINVNSMNSYLGALVEIQDVTPFLSIEKLRKDFISSVSHELRTPITSLTLSIQFLKKHLERIPKRKIYSTLDVMNDSAELLKTLIEDLLVVSKIENNQFRLEKEKFDIIKNIENTIRSFEEQIKHKKIQLEKKFSKRSLDFFGDPNRIKQIISNILDNAIKYSPANSLIEVSVLDDYIGEFNVRNENGLLIQIKDHGQGIKSKDLPFVFNRFFRTSESEKIEGSGLGLYIAKNLVELHQGKIFVDSTYQEGTTVSIFLPFVDH